ncbi:MAG: HEAT repeat domain-containing protein [Deltaproteobacteria bacterium]|nr:HEAT repeat domain-containing protein [Deltaproteobacteria bacterium]
MGTSNKLLMIQIAAIIFISLFGSIPSDACLPCPIEEKDLKVSLDRAKKNLENLNEEYACSFFYQVSHNGVKDFRDLPIIIDFTIQAIQAPSAKVKACAAEAMGWYGDQKAAPILLEATKSEDKEVRLQSAGALLQLGYEVDTAIETIDGLAQGKDATSNILGEMLRLQYDGKNWYISLLNGLDSLWDPKCETVLRKALNYPSREMRATALSYFSAKGEKDSVYSNAVSIVNDLKNKDIRNYLPEYANYSDADIQHLYPSDIPDSPNVDKLQSDGRSCSAAIHALGRINNRESRPLLEEVSRKNTEWWRVCSGAAAGRALQEISR